MHTLRITAARSFCYGSCREAGIQGPEFPDQQAAYLISVSLPRRKTNRVFLDRVGQHAGSLLLYSLVLRFIVDPTIDLSSTERLSFPPTTVSAACLYVLPLPRKTARY